MKIGATFGLVIGMTIALDPAFAQTARERQALNNIQHEMTTCAAFYALTKQCILNRERPSEDAEAIQKTNAVLQRLLKDAHKIGQTIGMTQDAMLSRLENDMTIMKTEVNNDCINISSLLRRHSMRCKQVTENPDSILVEYMGRR